MIFVHGMSAYSWYPDVSQRFSAASVTRYVPTWDNSKTTELLLVMPEIPCILLALL
jgi:hypothetical protein